MMRRPYGVRMSTVGRSSDCRVGIPAVGQQDGAVGHLGGQVALDGDVAGLRSAEARPTMLQCGSTRSWSTPL